MKIAIIGSTQYKDRMEKYKRKLEKRGFEVRMPVFDGKGERKNLDELGVCFKNLEMLEWADEARVFWDRRSLGTMFDFGMAFALGKPVKIAYLESRTFVNLLKQYEWFSKIRRKK